MPASIGFFTGLLGARLFHLLEHPREFLAHPAAMLLSRSGFTIFGGLIVGITRGRASTRARKRAPLAPMLDAVAPALMLGYAIGRIGCQISGDGDWGIAADLAAKPAWLPTWLWAQTYDGNIAGVTIPPPGVYPTPIYEALMGFAAFALLWRLRRHAHAPGWLFGVYLLLAGIERFARRTDPREHHLHRCSASTSRRRSSSPPPASSRACVCGCSCAASGSPDRDFRSRALTPSRRAADNTASTDAVAMFAWRPAP